MTQNKELEQLLISATESDNKETLTEIISILTSCEDSLTSEVKNSLSLIVDSWQQDPFNSPNKTRFIIEISRFFNEAFPELRSVLPAAVKKTLPKGINKTSAVKVLKIRDDNTTLSNFHRRYLNLMELKTDRFFYNTSSTTWGIIGKLDWITGTTTLLKLNGTVLLEVDISIILDQIYIFDSKIKLNSILKGKKIPFPNELIETLISNANTSTDRDIINKSLFSLFVPEKMNTPTFKKWLITSNSKKISSTQTNIISLDKVRSVSELNIFIKQHDSFTLTQDSIPKITTIFSTIKPSTNSLKDVITWVETLCLISKDLSNEKIQLITPSNDTITNTLWPAYNELQDGRVGMEIWYQLKAGFLPAWAKITEAIMGRDYLTGIFLYLPWRNWKAITSRLEVEEIEKTLNITTRLSNPEALLWIWRNREKLSDTIVNKLNQVNFFSAISRGADGAIWVTAEKELKALIQEKEEFQSRILIKDDDSSIIVFLEKLNCADTFTTTEKQSLIVKLSRKYPTLKKLFESGKVKKMITDSSNDKDSRKPDELFITSFKSFKEKIELLNDLINVQIPENTKAIAVARAHGDLRENAEYAAAKERQKFLNEHRGLLEKRMAITRPTDFSDIIFSGKVIVGSTVHLKYKNKKNEIYYILGSWDSIPEKKYISYETELGRVLIGRKTGDIITMPDGLICTIEQVNPLDEKIKATLV